MEVTDKLSIPNLIVSGAILLIMLIGKTFIILWIMRLQKEQRTIHEDVRSLMEQLRILPPAIVGELQVTWDLRQCGERLDLIEPRLELLERRMTALDPNGYPGGADK